MKAKRILCIIAYDIESNKNRTKIAKLLEKYGTRINFSVFECMFTEKQLEQVQVKIGMKLDKQSDTVVYYPICVNCFTKILYQPDRRKSRQLIMIV